MNEENKRPTLATLTAIGDEVDRARRKFPGRRFLLAALLEEVGELAEAIIGGHRDLIRREAHQVACVAIRIAEEGDVTAYRVPGFISMVAHLGNLARELPATRLPQARRRAQ
jgi:hypothetical protein